MNEVLTVDNHSDGPYMYLRLMKWDPASARGLEATTHTEVLIW